MTTVFKKLFWGVLIVNVRLHAGAIPILPAFVGWIIILNALTDLEEYLPEKDLRFVFRSVTVLLFLSLSGLLQFFGWELSGISLALQFFPVLSLLLELSAFHKLLEAVVRQYHRKNRFEKRDKRIGQDKWYIMLMGGAAATLAVSVTLNFVSVLLISVLLSLAARIYLLYLLFGLSKEDLELESTDKAHQLA